MPEGFLTLLPEDPDASAERLQKELSARLGLARLGVVITDTFGRPWREGVVDVAIGCAGLPPLIDLRGTADDHGTTLEATVVALADAVAAASGLVMTKTARVPAALVRGLDAAIGDAPPGPARALVRARADDLFWESALVAASAARRERDVRPGRRAAGPRGGGRPSRERRPLPSGMDVRRADLRGGAAPAALRRAETPDDAVPVGARADRARASAVAGSRTQPRTEASILLAAGAAIRTLVIALHAQGLGSWWDPDLRWTPTRPGPRSRSARIGARSASWRWARCRRAGPDGPALRTSDR